MRALIFDSGIGGVGIARAIRTLMPGAALTYLMDDAAFPYGGKAESDLVARVLRVVGAGIAAARPDLVVVACNTASTAALAALRGAYGLPFVGCVPPIKSAAAASRTRTVGVIATPATVRGPYLAALAARHAPDCRLLIHGAPDLARLAERRFAGKVVPQADVRDELAGLLAQTGSGEIDAVALGCTHYAWLLPQLRACLGSGVLWHDPALPVARQTQRVAAALAATPGGSDGLVLHTGALRPLAGAGWGAAGFHETAHLPLDTMADCASKTSGIPAPTGTMLRPEEAPDEQRC